MYAPFEINEQGGLRLEIYREDSLQSPEKEMYKYLSFLLVIAILGYELLQSYQGRMSPIGIGYGVVFVGLWVWKFVFRYTYILTSEEFIVISKGLGIKRTYRAELSSVESFTDNYVKSFFKKTKLRHYVHRQAANDTNPTRLIVFNRGGSLQGVLFKASDKMIKELRKAMPERFLPLQ